MKFLHPTCKSQTKARMPFSQGREVEKIMPSSHTYPVAVGFYPAATVSNPVRNYGNRIRHSHGSLPHRWSKRCPVNSLICLVSSNRVRSRPADRLAIYHLHQTEYPQHNLTCSIGQDNMMWGVPPGHLSPPALSRKTLALLIRTSLSLVGSIDD